MASDILPMLPADIGLPAKFHDWRPHQPRSIVNGIDSESRFIVKSEPTGSGKSVTVITHALLTGARTVILTSTKGLMDQYQTDFSGVGLADIRGRANYPCYLMEDYTCEDGAEARCPAIRSGACPYNRAWKRAMQADIVVTNYDYWMLSNKYGEGLGARNLLVCDEAHDCFPAGTLVDGRPIESLRAGDSVISLSGSNLLPGKVLRTFKIQAARKRMVRLSISGRRVVTTSSHPFMTLSGWRRADQLKGDWILYAGKTTRDSEYQMYDMFEADAQCKESEQARPLFRDRQNLLLPSLPGSQCPSATFGDWPDGSHQVSRDNYRENENFESDARSESAEENVGHFKKNRPYAENSRRQWIWSHYPSETAGNETRLAHGGGCSYEEGLSTSTMLQIGHRESVPEDRDRGRREFSSPAGTQATGSEERQFSYWHRVESVEILEPTSDGTFGGLCPDGFVYDIEVESTHNYLVDGYVVHNCPDKICEVMSVELTSKEILHTMRSNFPSLDAPLTAWQAWARPLHITAVQLQERLVDEILDITRTGGTVPRSWAADLKHLKNLVRKLDTIVTAVGNWIVSGTPRGVRLDPVWPWQYAESTLFRGIPKIMLVSATVLPKTMDLLGVPMDEYDFQEYPSTFDPRLSPVIAIDTAYHNFRSDSNALMQLIIRTDQIIASRLDRKGIIHSRSYANRDMVMEHSRFKDILISHESHNTQARVQYFKAAPPPAVLVSPSVTTGYDFPYSSCEFQILIKVPHPDMRSPVMAARDKEDPQYKHYLMTQTLVQTCGRGRRAADDQCENFIIDNSIFSVMKHHKLLLPRWFRALYRRADLIPPPPPRLQKW